MAATDSPLAAVYARVRPTLEGLQRYANDPRPAYTLSGLCMWPTYQGAAALPFGFAQTTSNVKTARVVPRLVPPFWQLAGFSALFATGGYIISQGDTLNGSGVITGMSYYELIKAWSLTYLTFKTLPTLPWMARSPVSLLLNLGVCGIGLGVYGNYYFDKASWRGAIPGLMPKPGKNDGGYTKTI